MSAIPDLTEEEKYLAAIFDDPSGIELAEFLLVDEETEDGCFRAYDYQWTWFRADDRFQIDMASRDVGKSFSIQLRCMAFPFCFPGAEMLITAPELSHLRPICDKVESQLLSVRLLREMLPKRRGNGINHQPQFQVEFINKARLISRLPQRDGRGVKGCIAAGALVLTERGHVPVEDLRVGDQVMTHRGRWRPVVAIGQVGDSPGYRIRGGGNREILVSENHQMLTRVDRSRGKKKRDLDAADWTILDSPARSDGLGSSLTEHYLGSPVDFPASPVPAAFASTEILWAVGRYLADGYLSARSAGGTLNKVHWIVPPKKLDQLLEGLRKAGLSPTERLRGNGTYMVEVCSVDLAGCIEREFGRHAAEKRLPAWALGMPASDRSALLGGYLAGDGYWDAKKRRYSFGSASKDLALGMRLLGQSLGYAAGLSWADPKVTEICGRKLNAPPQRSWRVNLSSCSNVARGTASAYGLTVEAIWQKVREVESVPVGTVYDVAVDEDQSYVADGIIHHNIHALRIELDEAQDYPSNGFTEITESMKHRMASSQWRIHGVSRGVSDRFTQLAQNKDPKLKFRVHRIMAMHRPSWSEEERGNKIALYGGTEEHVDYKRNVYGEMADASASLFVMHRLMGCVRINESTWASKYNDDIYTQIKISDDLLRGSGAPIEAFLQFNGAHLDSKYVSFWSGQDVGFTRDPSEILVFGELAHPERKSDSLLRLLTRVHMMRVSAADQAAAVRAIFDFYGDRLRRHAMDKTGNGLPLWQELDPDAVGTHVSLRRTPEHISSRIKGYGFSNKVAVEFDDRELRTGETDQDAVIQKNVVEFAADELRKLVDMGSLELPFDQELLSEWQGQEIQYVRDDRSAAGLKTRLVGGSLHTLDAALMMVAGRNLMNIEAALKVRERKQTPRLTRFM